MTQAAWKANLKTAIALLGVGMATTATIPLVMHPLPTFSRTSIATGSGTISASANTKSESTQEALRQLNQWTAMKREQLQLAALMQYPGASQRLNQAIKTSPHRFLPKVQIHWRMVHSRSGKKMKQAYGEINLIPPMRLMEQAMEMKQKAQRVNQKGPVSAITPQFTAAYLSPRLTVRLAYGQNEHPTVQKFSGIPEVLRRRLNPIARHQSKRTKHRSRRW